MSEEWSGWGPVSQPRNQTLSCLQTLMPLHFHPISMELQQYKTWHPICLHSPLCVWSVLVRVHTREAGAYIMCFLEGAVAQSSFMGERERERKRKDWFAALCFQKNCHRGFLHRVCTMAADRVYPWQASWQPGYETKWTRSLYFKQIKGHIGRTRVWNLIPRLSALGNLTPL